MLNSDPEDQDIIEISPSILDDRPSALKARISRRPVTMAVAIMVIAAVAAVAVFAAVGPAAAPAPHVNPALAKLIAEVTSVPEKAGDSAYSGFVPDQAEPVTGAPLTQGGKPEVFYVNAGYCPYCAAQNWALIVALSRFGTFSGLSTVRTHHYEGVPPVDGWMFYGSSFTSKYLAFVPVETWSDTLVSRKANPDDAKSYRKLQRLTPAQQSLFDKYDKTRAVPFADFANRAVQTGSSLEPSALAGQTWSQIASTLGDGHTAADRAILSAASSLTAELCQLTGNKPASACPPGIISFQLES